MLTRPHTGVPRAPRWQGSLAAASLPALLLAAAGALPGPLPGSRAMAQTAHERRDVRPHAASDVVRFLHSSGGYWLDHPVDWRAHERGDRTNIGADDGLVAGERGFRTIYGVIVQVVDNPVAGAADASLEAATRSVVEAVLKRNAHQALHAPVKADGTLGGAPAFSAVLMGTSPVTGRGERAEIVCREYGPTQILSLILVSPADDFPLLERPLKRLRDSVGVRTR